MQVNYVNTLLHHCTSTAMDVHSDPVLHKADLSQYDSTYNWLVSRICSLPKFNHLSLFPKFYKNSPITWVKTLPPTTCDGCNHFILHTFVICLITPVFYDCSRLQYQTLINNYWVQFNQICMILLQQKEHHYFQLRMTICKIKWISLKLFNYHKHSTKNCTFCILQWITASTIQIMCINRWPECGTWTPISVLE